MVKIQPGDVDMTVATWDTLPRTMRAVRCVGPEDYRLEEWPVPTPGPGEVLIKLDACGVCASDVKCFVGAPMFWTLCEASKVAPALACRR